MLLLLDQLLEILLLLRRGHRLHVLEQVLNNLLVVVCRLLLNLLLLLHLLLQSLLFFLLFLDFLLSSKSIKKTKCDITSRIRRLIVASSCLKIKISNSEKI